MFEERLPTQIWVEALIRRAQLAGAAGFVVHAGDAARGDVVIKVADLSGGARVYVPRTGMDGSRRFAALDAQGVGPDEASADDYFNRARQRDADVWLVEIEDPQGRHFLTEPVEP